MHSIRVDRNLVGLLFFMLERLSIRDAFNESPRIGLPVDDFDCSRTLAHMVLFPHDERMAKLVGEGSYVRWMDDQNFGASSYAEGLKVLRQCGDSLARLHLTPNASKSRILSLAEARRHFHLDINADLDSIEEMLKDAASDQRDNRIKLGQIWRKSRRFERDGGEWGKVLKRFYLLAGKLGARFLRSRAVRDTLREPVLAGRVADYVRVTGSVKQYLSFVQRLWSHEEQVYPDISLVLAEGLLRLEPDRLEAGMIRKVASGLLSGKCNFPGWEICATIAPLLILRFGDRRSLPLLERLVDNVEDGQYHAVTKAAIVVYASFGVAEYSRAKGAISRLKDNYLAHVFRMLDTCVTYEIVPDRFKIRREPSYDAVARMKRIDMRKLLVPRLLQLNDRTAVRTWIREAKRWMMRQDISDFDKRMIARLLPE